VLRDVAVDAGFLCEEAAVLRRRIKENSLRVEQTQAGKYLHLDKTRAEMFME